MTKYPENSLGGKKTYSFYHSRLQSVIMGKSRQGLEAIGDVTSTAKGREKWKHVCLLACAQLRFSTLTQFSLLGLGNGAAHSGLGFLLTQSRQSHTDVLTWINPRLSSQVNLGIMEMTVQVSRILSDKLFVNHCFQPLCLTENVSSSAL